MKKSTRIKPLKLHIIKYVCNINFKQAFFFLEWSEHNLYQPKSFIVSSKKICMFIKQSQTETSIVLSKVD